MLWNTKMEIFLDILKKNDTVSEYSCPETSQQNSRDECKHKQILKYVRSLLIFANIPKIF